MESYPLHWPEGWARTPAAKRSPNSRFNTTFDAARKKLLAEMKLLGATNVVISSWLPLRNDGQPFAAAARQRMEDPGVAVYFTLRQRPMVMARDAFTSVHDNLTSLYHAISHLRGLERHGGSAMMERAFGGFAALPAPGETNAAHWTTILGRPENWRELTPETQRMWIQGRYTTLARTAHPDRGGNESDFTRLVEARQAALANVGAPLEA